MNALLVMLALAAADGDRRFVMDNGMIAVLREVPGEPVVAVTVAYGVGAADDPDERAGLAHLVEHLTFRGTKHTKPFEVLSSLEAVGGRDMNASTYLDATAYYAVVPTGALERMLWSEADRMAFTLEVMSDASFADEHPVVMREMRGRRGGIGGRFFAYARRAFFGDGHPYAGVEDELEQTAALTAHDARWLFQQTYRPDNAVVTLVGAFDTARAEAMVRKHLGTVVAPAIPKRARPTAPERSERCREIWVTARVAAPVVEVWWAVDGDFDAVEVATIVLKERLSEQLQKQYGAAVYVASGVQRQRLDSHAFVRIVGARDANANALKSLVLDEVRQLRDLRFGTRPVVDAIRGMRNSRAADADDRLDVGRDLALAELGVPVRGAAPEGAVEVQTAARKHLTPKRRFVAVLDTKGETTDVARTFGRDCR